jgi:hypothetical protein
VCVDGSSDKRIKKQSIESIYADDSHESPIIVLPARHGVVIRGAHLQRTQFTFFTGKKSKNIDAALTASSGDKPS